MEAISQREQTRLRELAAEYRDRGYVVLIHPSVDERPDFLRDLQPDLIASRDDEHIIFEIRSKPSLKDEPLQSFVKAVENRPGWRFELILTNPRESGKFGDDYELVDLKGLEEMVVHSETLLLVGETKFAALIVWIAIEGVLVTYLSRRINLPATGRAPKRLLKEGVSLGLIEQADFHRLERLAEFRNRFVHAMQIPPMSVSEVEDLQGVARRLIAQAVNNQHESR